MPRKVLPKYRFNKTSGRAVVTLNGVDHWLGKYDSPESREKYDRLIAEWLAGGRQSVAAAPERMPLVGLIGRYWTHVEAYYRKQDGTPTSEVDNIRRALRHVDTLYGSIFADEFRPANLAAIQQSMIMAGWHRRSINKQISRVRAMFKWGVSKELVAATVYQALSSVAGLKKGRTEAKESPKVRPVADEHVDAIKDFVSRQVWAMIQLQRLTGMRPGEVVIMRACDIDMGKEVWEYQPEHHKTEHQEHERTIYLGGRAQELLRPFLGPVLVKYLFSPIEAEQERLATAHANRKTPLSCGNVPGSNRTRRPLVKAGHRYIVASYRRAIERGCEMAFPLPASLARVPRVETRREWMARLTPEQKAEMNKWNKDHRWHPHQLRHSVGTRLRKEFGIDAAKVILGHATLEATEIYAEQDREKAVKVAQMVGCTKFSTRPPPRP